jgi:hypothetical protein
MNQSKSVLNSKGIALGLFTLLASLAQWKWGLVVSPELQGVVVGVLVIIVRMVTKEPVTIRRKK